MNARTEIKNEARRQGIALLFELMGIGVRRLIDRIRGRRSEPVTQEKEPVVMVDNSSELDKIAARKAAIKAKSGAEQAAQNERNARMKF